MSHLYTVAIQEWGLGLTFNPVLNIRKPSPGDGRDRRLSPDEERHLLAAVNRHSNPMLEWIVCIALETGMRSSEISSLRRPQVDLAKRVIRLSDTKNEASRTVPLSKRAACGRWTPKGKASVEVFIVSAERKVDQLTDTPLLASHLDMTAPQVVAAKEKCNYADAMTHPNRC